MSFLSSRLELWLFFAPSISSNGNTCSTKTSLGMRPISGESIWSQLTLPLSGWTRPALFSLTGRNQIPTCARETTGWDAKKPRFIYKRLQRTRVVEVWLLVDSGFGESWSILWGGSAEIFIDKSGVLSLNLLLILQKTQEKMLMHFLTKNNIFLTTAQFVFLSFSVFCKSSYFVKLKKSKHSFKVRMRSYTLISLTCSSLLYAPTQIPISPKEVLFFQAVDQLKEARRSSSAALCPSADLCFKVWL